MDRDTLFEEIRTRLREVQEQTVTDVWLYQDEDLIMAVRSAIRQLRVIHVALEFDLDLTGAFDTDPTETQGMLLALKVVADLLKGDLTKKLNNGELGVSVKSLLDSYSSTEGAKGFAKAAESYAEEFKTLLTIVLSDNVDTATGTFGTQGTSFSDT